MTATGGDPACWLDRVCERCGAFVESESVDDHVCRTGEQPEPADVLTVAPTGDWSRVTGSATLW